MSALLTSFPPRSTRRDGSCDGEQDLDGWCRERQRFPNTLDARATVDHQALDGVVIVQRHMVGVARTIKKSTNENLGPREQRVVVDEGRWARGRAGVGVIRYGEGGGCGTEVGGWRLRISMLQRTMMRQSRLLKRARAKRRKKMLTLLK